MTPEEIGELRALVDRLGNTRYDKNLAAILDAVIEHIDQQAAQLAEYRKPVEQMDTMRLAEWNEKLTELLSATEDEREYLPWQIAVGDHLEKFAKSWHSARIAELEAKAAALQTEEMKEALDEIERLRAIIDTPSEEPEWVVDFKKLNRFAGVGYSLIDIEIAKKWHTAYRKAQNSNLLRKQEIERMLGEIKELEAENINLETLNEGLLENGNDLRSRAQKAEARIQELEAALVEADQCRRSLLDQVMKVANQRDKAEVRIQELEEPLVEERARCIELGRAASTGRFKPVPPLQESKKLARRQLQRDGKIGPDVKPRSWKITDERKAAILHCKRMLTFLKEDDAPCYDVEKITKDESVLVAMLEEAGQ